MVVRPRDEREDDLCDRHCCGSLRCNLDGLSVLSVFHVNRGAIQVPELTEDLISVDMSYFVQKADLRC